MSLLIHINDEMLDLNEDTKVALTINGLNLKDLSARTIDFTNRIKVPKTRNNETILGNISLINSTTRSQYSVLDCRVVQDGVEFIENPKMVVSSVDKDINFTLYSSELELFQQIKGVDVYSINVIPSSGWLASDIDASRTSTSGLFAAVVNYGKPPLNGIYDYNYFLPSIYYHTVIRAILESTGLTLSGDILTDPRFTELIIPFPGDTFRYPDRFINPLLGRAESSGEGIFNLYLAGIDAVGTLDNVIYGSYFEFSDRYTVPFACDATLTSISNVSAVTFNDGTYVKCILMLNGVTELDSGLVTTVTGTITNEVTVNLAAGDYIQVIYQTDAPAIGTSFSCNSTLIVTPTNEVNRSFVFWNEILWGDLKCDDLLSHFFTTFCLEFKQENGVLYLQTVQKKLENVQDSIDWTDKFVRLDKMEFSYEFSKSNLFLYEKSEDVVDQAVGRGVLPIDSDILKEESEYFNTVFGNSNTGYVKGWITTTIPVYDSTSTSVSDFKDTPGLRLLTVKARTTEPAITFDVSSRTDYKIGYFVDNNQPKDTSFQYFLNEFYPVLIDSLQDTKKITAIFNLSTTDIQTYDKFKTVYVNGNYYIVLKISNFVAGQLTKVELLRI